MKTKQKEHRTDLTLEALILLNKATWFLRAPDRKTLASDLITEGLKNRQIHEKLQRKYGKADMGGIIK